MGDRRNRRTYISISVLAICIAISANATEGVPPLPRDGALALLAESANGLAVLVVPAEAGTWDPNTQTYEWQLQSPVDLVDPDTGEFVGALLDGFVRYETGAHYELSFGIGFFAGGQEASVRAYSPLVGIEPLPQELAAGRASASVTLTDIGGDGALVQGVGDPGAGICMADYGSSLGSSRRFTELIGAVAVDNGGTATASSTDPQFGYRALDTDVKTFTGTIVFDVSASDLVYASVVFGLHKPADCAGDVDGDGIVGEADLAALLAAFGTSEGDPQYDHRADFNGDLQVDSNDLTVLISNYGQVCDE